MTLQEIKNLFAYNAWATNRIFDALKTLPEDKFSMDFKAGHGSIRGTLTHLVAAEKIWLSRLTGTPEATMLSEKDAPSLSALKEIWEDVAARTARFVAGLDKKKMSSTFQMTTTRGIPYTHVYQDALLHLVNHSTYHRGQIAVLMRQVGAQPVGTDLIAFYRLTAQPDQKV